MALNWNPIAATVGSYQNKNPNYGFTFDRNTGTLVKTPSTDPKFGYSFDTNTNQLQRVGSNVQSSAVSNNEQANKKLTTEQVNKGLSIAGDVIGLGSDLFGTASEKLNIGKPTQYFQEGVDPSYQVGDYFNRAYSARPQGATGGEILGTSLKAAKIGAQIGGGWGAAIGAGVGALGSIGAGEIRRARQRREKDKALKLAGAEQQKFNTAQEEYDKQQMAQAEYTRRANPYRRMSNLYNI